MSHDESFVQSLPCPVMRLGSCCAVLCLGCTVTIIDVCFVSPNKNKYDVLASYTLQLMMMEHQNERIALEAHHREEEERRKQAVAAMQPGGPWHGVPPTLKLDEDWQVDTSMYSRISCSAPDCTASSTRCCKCTAITNAWLPAASALLTSILCILWQTSSDQVPFARHVFCTNKLFCM